MAVHAEDLRRYLTRTTGRPITLRLNSNFHTMVTARPERPGRGIAVSLHRMFLHGSRDVMEALARFIVAPTKSSRETIRVFIHENTHRIGRVSPTRPPKTRHLVGTPVGEQYDLEERAARLNERHFGGELQFRIIWGRRVHSGCTQRHATLGTWNKRTRTIRIHPMLDHPRVPWYFLDYVIYHEMAHVAVPSRLVGSRTAHHTREFYEVERSFPWYQRALTWEQRWLAALLRQWNGGRELPPQAAR